MSDVRQYCEKLELQAGSVSVVLYAVPLLGGHIEFNSDGKAFQWKSQFHPNEHVLQLTKDDLLALPDAVSNFHGSSMQRGKFLMMKGWRVVF